MEKMDKHDLYEISEKIKGKNEKNKGNSLKICFFFQ